MHKGESSLQALIWNDLPEHPGSGKISLGTQGRPAERFSILRVSWPGNQTLLCLLEPHNLQQERHCLGLEIELRIYLFGASLKD